nr:drug resistance MFS transporter, drug:H+ antiporter-2 (14 Spanner) (DHA2) family [uncultured bacterium]
MAQTIGLIVLLSWQLMVVLDGTIVNIALADIRQNLGFSDTSLSWVVNAYALAFGGLLMLGSRAGDMFGRRRLLITGVVVFTVASALGGIASNQEMLIIARVLQGVGAAMAAPSTLSLIVTNFEAGAARNRALSLFASVSGVGASIGLILGGVLTSWLSWHWIFFVNVPIGIAVAVLAPRFVAEAPLQPGRLDIGGAIASTLGVTALVYGFIRAAEVNWTDPLTIASFVAAVILLGAFVAIERRVAQPILPFRLFNERKRSIAFINQLLVPATLFGVFFFLTQYLQVVLGMSAVQSGFAFLPFSATIVIGSRLVPRAVARFGPRTVMIFGGLAVATGLVLMSRLDETASYFPLVFISMVIMASGAVASFVSLSLAIMGTISPEDSGPASGLMQTNQQIGGAIGLAVLVTVFGTVNANALADGSNRIEAMVAGMQRGFLTAAGIALLVTVIAAVGYRSSNRDQQLGS